MYSLIPRQVAFQNDKCIAYGISSSNYTFPDVNKKIIKFPSDNYDFFGPINPIGKNKEEIIINIVEFVKSHLNDFSEFSIDIENLIYSKVSRGTE